MTAPGEGFTAGPGVRSGAGGAIVSVVVVVVAAVVAVVAVDTGDGDVVEVGVDSLVVAGREDTPRCWCGRGFSCG